MGKRKENEPRVYIIPKNFLDSGYVFGGRFKQRNFIEAAALTAPVFGIFLYGWKVVGWDVGSTVAACIILCTGVFKMCIRDSDSAGLQLPSGRGFRHHGCCH